MTDNNMKIFHIHISLNELNMEVFGSKKAAAN